MRHKAPRQARSQPQLQQTLEAVLRSRREIAAELQETASHLSGGTRRRCLALSRWFKKPTTAEDVLRRPAALAVCLPLLEPASRGEISPLDIEDAVASALTPLRRSFFQSRHLIADLLYPLVLLLLCGCFWVAFAVFLAPLFEQMFDEFELLLPPPTFAVIGLARVTRRWGIVGASLVALLLGMLGAALYLERHWLRSSRLSGFMTGWFSGARAAWAAWAWHVALLLDAGLSQPDAISWAGRGSNTHRLGEISESWAEHIRKGDKAYARRIPHGTLPGHLLRNALQFEDLSDQAELLREVAAIDWYRCRSRSRWWLWWVTPVTVCGVGAMIGLIVMALFVPLVELITGLG